MTIAAMKTRLKHSADKYPESTRVRLRWTLSWLGRAEKETKAPDAAFIFLRIAFNADYTREFAQDKSELRGWRVLSECWSD